MPDVHNVPDDDADQADGPMAEQLRLLRPRMDGAEIGRNTLPSSWPQCPENTRANRITLCPNFLVVQGNQYTCGYCNRRQIGI